MPRLLTAATRVRVSSVLHGDRAAYGPQHLTDGQPDTCWNSARGSPQRVSIRFHRRVHPRTIAFLFQGGFVGRECAVLTAADTVSV